MSAVPLVGFGTFNGWTNPEAMAAAVKVAIEVGYRHIDCASLYDNEKEIGQALAETFADGKVKREDLFIVSKLPQPAHGRDQVRPRLEQTLKDLQLQQLDLYLIHWPEAWTKESWQGTVGQSGKGSRSDHDDLGNVVYYDFDVNVTIKETWQALEECVDLGLTKAIGVSNFSIQQIQDILSFARVKPAAQEIELHPYLTQRNMVEFCQKHGIHVTAYSSIGRGSHKATDAPELLHDATVNSIAQSVNKTPTQVLLRWATQQHISVIPKSLNRSRIVENFAIHDFSLSSEQMHALSALNRNLRFVQPIWHTFDD